MKLFSEIAEYLFHFSIYRTANNFESQTEASLSLFNAAVNFIWYRIYIDDK